jgi:hypothetical protein
MEPSNRFRVIDFASLCSLAGRWYDKSGCRTGPLGWESITGSTNTGSVNNSMHCVMCISTSIHQGLSSLQSILCILLVHVPAASVADPDPHGSVLFREVEFCSASRTSSGIHNTANCEKGLIIMHTIQYCLISQQFTCQSFNEMTIMHNIDRVSTKDSHAQ